MKQHEKDFSTVVRKSKDDDDLDSRKKNQIHICTHNLIVFFYQHVRAKWNFVFIFYKNAYAVQNNI